MSDFFAEYEKKKEYLICVDSDGCAMDTMEIKHRRCFGPCMIEEWGLENWCTKILTRWNEINLYSMTRGINRFQGLSMMLQEVRETYCPIEDLDALTAWVQTSPELSNPALERAVQQSGSVCLRKALRWSQAVNRSIERLAQEEKCPFEGVRQALAYAHRYADIAVVSSANLGAVLDEWDFYGLLEHTDMVLAQDAGSKAACIGTLMKKGYAPSHVVMCGDAPGDLDAARANGVLFFPILVRHETESWAEFSAMGLSKLINGSFAGAYQQEKIEQFIGNLGG